MDEVGPESSQTLPSSPPPREPVVQLDLSILPPIFLSATHFETDDLHELEEELVQAHAALTYDVTEAKIVLSRATKKPRIQFDLRSKGLWTEEVTLESSVPKHKEVLPSSARETKRQKVSKAETSKNSDGNAIVIDDSSTASEGEDSPATGLPGENSRAQKVSKNATVSASSLDLRDEEHLIKVIRVEWFELSRKAGKVLPFDDFLSYHGRRIDKPVEAPLVKPVPPTRARPIAVKKSTPTKAILERAKEDAPLPTGSRPDHLGKRKFGVASKTATGASWEAGHGSNSQYAHLLHTTTSEHDEGISSDLPEMPDWVKQRIKYACQRSTPRTNPNDPFLALLKKIKLARLLTNDEIGVRAYSTSIASLAAYPYNLSHPREILALPGCDNKIANLFVEWKNTGAIKAVEDIDADEELKVLRLFYEIWGVGATTARDFYFDRGWRELDDIVEYGWSALSRVQQIGVKYYDEFLDPIPRPEVEEIGRIIHRHAVAVRDDGVQSLIVGGYRRGKEACGDVDMIVSHPDEHQTLNIVNDIVASLEEEGWVTHTLLLSLNSTKRGQQTLPFKTGQTGGHGFDTLDKALVVWQDPSWPTKGTDLAANPKAKNPNIHRRVDIIISPWRTVGCAVAGWSGGTTFQRDLRRYAKNVKGWKFDSSGVRSRVNGEVVDLEGWSEYHGAIGKGRAKNMEEAEKRVFEGMGLVYREPWDRCTG